MRREIELDRTLVMGILNVTPDSFSDGGHFLDSQSALKRVERMLSEGVDIIDIGGESTRPGSSQVPLEVEIQRVAPLVAEIVKRFDIPISIDTSKSDVAKAGLDAGAEIVNDISGLRFDPAVGEIVAARSAGIVLMHSRGNFATMHSQPPVEDIFLEITKDFERAIAETKRVGISPEQIVLDVGIGFGKTFEQNLELIANLRILESDFGVYPILVGASRKSFIGKVLNEPNVDDRLTGSLTAAAIAVWNGADILRVHDVGETAKVIKVVASLLSERHSTIGFS